MKKIKELHAEKLVEFFNNNADILHVSRYHKEDFRVHCLLVIGGMLPELETESVSEEAFVAACLHDIAKPRTAKLNKRNEACFYGHENVTDEELVEFLEPSYPGFSKVADLVRAHMLPLSVTESTPEPFRSQNQERLDEVLAKNDERFKTDLLILSQCDRFASVKTEEALARAKGEADIVMVRLLREQCN